MSLSSPSSLPFDFLPRSFVCLTLKGTVSPHLHRKFHTEDVRPFTNDDSPPIDFHLPSRGYILSDIRAISSIGVPRERRATDRNFRRRMNIRSRRRISRKLDIGRLRRSACSKKVSLLSLSLSQLAKVRFGSIESRSYYTVVLLTTLSTRRLVVALSSIFSSSARHR